MDINIREATPDDVGALVDLVRACLDGMRNQGIDQWDDVYPDRATIERDVAGATAFVATLDSSVLGMAVLNEHQEREYADVPWRFAGRTMVIHRLMVAPAAEGKGVARALMLHLETRGEAVGFDCVRLDAFSGNARAVRFYERAKYRLAGHVRFRKGDFHCFEKQLGALANPPLQTDGASPRR